MNYPDKLDALEAIAIIGLAGRFPGASNIDIFWQNLCSGRESISHFSDEELQDAGISDPTLLEHPNFVKAKGIIDDVEWFDAPFFGFNPREAQIIDPQHRIFLECAWEALEHAGYDPATYSGSIGVYAGASMNSYLLNNIVRNPNLLATVGPYQAMLGNDKDFMPTRVSYKLNLTGPSVNIQTACSTSLVAVQLACQGLLDYQCDMALAGGVSISFPHKTGYLYQEGMILSPDGHCRAFDAEAGGTVGGEGVGIVVLKRLSEAVAAGDYIWAVIKGAAINNDGSLKVGYTAPSVDGQATAIAMAQAMAEIEPETISYIEAHGTGTALGDPIEIAALTEVFRAKTDKKGFCAVGSVKTNIGHLDAAAGVAGLIKTTLALEHQLLPPSLHFKSPNPRIDFAESPFYVNTAPTPWQTNGQPRRAGVSSFGIGGTNAHVVLEESPIRVSQRTARPQQLLLLSAKTPTALESATQNLANHLKQKPDLHLADVAYTLQVGRQAFEQRRMVVCHHLDEAVAALETLDPQRVLTASAPSNTPGVVFMFTGQGSQYVDMAREIYQSEPIFRQQVDHCAEFLRSRLGLDLREILYPAPKHEKRASQQLRQTALAQPALFVIELALAKLWQTWGIQPQAMIGHSIGEYVAACLAGVFSLEEGLTLVAERGRLMQSMPAGAMLAVHLPEAQLKSYLGDGLALAAINGPSLCVVSGPAEAIAALQHQFDKQGVGCQPLHTSHAFHSPMMESAVKPFTQLVKSINLQAPQLPFISNVTGTWITAAQATDPAYWAEHLRQPVRFAAGIETLLTDDPYRLFLEIGPGQTLSALVRQQPHQQALPVLASLRHPREQTSDAAFLLKTVGKLWLAGVSIDWPGFHAHEQRYRLPLPTYPFERQRYWVEPRNGAQLIVADRSPAGKKPDLADWFYVPSWQRNTPLAFLHENVVLDQEQCWLVFATKNSLSNSIVQHLRQAGQTIVTVERGTHFDHLDALEYTVDPHRPEDYHALLASLRESNHLPEVVLHLWSVTTAKPDLGLETITGTLHRGFYSLLYLAQALGETGLTGPLKIQAVSNHLHEVTGEETLEPDKATLLGPCRVIPHEYPHLQCRNIDIILPRPDTPEEDRLVEYLVAEAGLESDNPIVAYRGPHRWVQTFAAARIETVKAQPTLLRRQGVYLISGGLGGVGLVLAEYLAQTVQARLVLTGRTALPPKSEWDPWLATHTDQDKVSRTIRQVRRLEKLGAEVLVVKADVADARQMQAAVAQARQKFGPIHGVIHAAGVAGGGLIQLKTSAAAEAVLAAKVTGTLVLDTLFRDDKLDFMVLCSSINAVLTTLGQVDYCAANAFLDAFAHYRHSGSRPAVISINWDTWQEVGMAVDTEVPAHLEQWKIENLKTGLSNREGQELFERALANPLPQLLVSTQDFSQLIEFSKTSVQSALNETPVIASNGKLDGESPNQPSSAALHARPNLSTEYVAPTTDLEQKVTDIWQGLLGVAQIGIHDNFFELGGHSLLATQIVSRLREEFQVELPLRSLFEATTIADLAERLETVLWAARSLQTSSEFSAEEREEIEL